MLARQFTASLRSGAVRPAIVQRAAFVRASRAYADKSDGKITEQLGSAIQKSLSSKDKDALERAKIAANEVWQLSGMTGTPFPLDSDDKSKGSSSSSGKSWDDLASDVQNKVKDAFNQSLSAKDKAQLERAKIAANEVWQLSGLTGSPFEIDDAALESKDAGSAKLSPEQRKEEERKIRGKLEEAKLHANEINELDGGAQKYYDVDGKYLPSSRPLSAHERQGAWVLFGIIVAAIVGGGIFAEKKYEEAEKDLDGDKGKNKK